MWEGDCWGELTRGRGDGEVVVEGVESALDDWDDCSGVVMV